MNTANQSTVKIFNKEYRITCPEGQEKKLSEATDLLNRRIQKEKSANAGVGNEQTMAITALNLAHELLEQNFVQQQRRQRENDAIKSCLQKINAQFNAGRAHQP